MAGRGGISEWRGRVCSSDVFRGQFVLRLSGIGRIPAPAAPALFESARLYVRGTEVLRSHNATGNSTYGP